MASSVDHRAKEKCPRFRAASYTALPLSKFVTNPLDQASVPHGMRQGRRRARWAVNVFSLDAFNNVPSKSKYAATLDMVESKRPTYMSNAPNFQLRRRLRWGRTRVVPLCDLATTSRTI